MQAGLRPLIIDCGGNIGLAAVWFAVQFPGALIYSIEPDIGNFTLLQTNCRHYANIVPVHGAIWNRPSQVTIENPSAGAGAFRVCESTDKTDSHNVRAYTIDEIREQSGNTGILIVKIDIEGGEKNLFSSNTNWVSDTGLIVAELHDWLYPWAGTSKPFFACLSRQDASYVFRGENIFCFRP